MTRHPARRTCPHHHRPSTVLPVLHSHLRTRLRRQRRYRCKDCGHTFSANAGSPYHRLRHRPEVFDRVVAMSVEGASKSSIARAFGISPQTVARWIERAARHANAFRERAVRNVDPAEVQVDELRTYAATKHRPSWIYTGLEVWSRLWLTSRVGRRTVRNTRIHFRDVRERCSPVGEPVLLTSDGFEYNERAARRVLGPRWVYVQIEKYPTGGGRYRTRKRLVLGNEWRLEAAQARSEDSRKLNTAYVERLNLTLRRSIAALHRRTTAWVRSDERLEELVTLLQVSYDFVRRHSSLPGRKTPAMQAGLATRPLRLRDIFLSGIQTRWAWRGPRQLGGRGRPCGSNS